MSKVPIKFYNKAWFIWVMLILFTPIGLFFLWKNKKYNKPTRLILTTMFSIWFLFAFIPSNNADTPNKTSERDSIYEPSENIPGKPGSTPENGQQNDNVSPTTSPVPTRTTTEEVNFEAAKVVRTIDGDTIEVNVDNGETEKIRLIGIDTPESTTSHEPYGSEASDFTNKSLTGKTVYIEKDVSDRDRYGRLLRIVWLERPVSISESDIRSKMFNAILVLKGYAQVSTYPPDVKYSEYFTRFTKEAREADVGLWSIKSEKTPTPQLTLKPSPTKSTVSDKTEGKIKGNISSSGEKIYHLPGGAYYDRTIAEEYFETEADAQAAGYRRSKR